MKNSAKKKNFSTVITVVALVTLAAVLIVRLFGTQIKEVFHRITGTVGGQVASPGATKNASGDSSNKRQMDTFDKGQADGGEGRRGGAVYHTTKPELP